MLSEDTRNISASLGELAGKVGAEEWDYIRGVKNNLDSLATQIEELEKTPVGFVPSNFQPEKGISITTDAIAKKTLNPCGQVLGPIGAF